MSGERRWCKAWLVVAAFLILAGCSAVRDEGPRENQSGIPQVQRGGDSGGGGGGM